MCGLSSAAALDNPHAWCFSLPAGKRRGRANQLIPLTIFDFGNVELPRWAKSGGEALDFAHLKKPPDPGGGVRGGGIPLPD